MARSIVLRFDAQCVDCGASLPAGSTARWFGRGRVSCCGAGAPAAGAPPVARPALPPRCVPVPLSSMLPPSASDRARSFVDDTQAAIDRVAGARSPLSAAQSAALPPELASALACGMQAHHVAELARIAPSTRLLVRLSSGARFIVPAEHAAHVIRCVSESLVDRIRDVMGAAS